MNTNKKELIIVLALTLVVVIVWVLIEVFKFTPSATTNPKLQSVIKPLDPSFDKSVLQQIQNIDIKRIDTASSSAKSNKPLLSP